MPAAEDVVVAQADGLETVCSCEDLSIEFVDQLGDGIWAEGLADFVFNFGQVGVVPLGAAAGGIDKALDLGVACGAQHVEHAIDVVLVGGDGVSDTTGD